MTKKLVEIEYDDNLHLGNASDGSGRKRGTLYNDNNELKGQVYIREVDEAEWGDGRHPADFFSEENSESKARKTTRSVMRTGRELPKLQHSPWPY